MVSVRQVTNAKINFMRVNKSGTHALSSPPLLSAATTRPLRYGTGQFRFKSGQRASTGTVP
jgi:hypothetical protein